MLHALGAIRYKWGRAEQRRREWMVPGSIRVFVSSTMNDLANERRAVVRAIEDLSLEAVNAEALLPSGGTSWNVLKNEIETSHLFVLILGERYGWIPTSGHGAGAGKSVTHLETLHAKSLGMPILPFQKKLDRKAPARSADAKMRDSFRREIGAWDSGYFLAEFDLYDDLAAKVRQALLDVFRDTYLKRQVRDVAAALPHRAAPAPAPKGPSRVQGSIGGPDKVLFAGAGMSIGAGYPTASALTEIIARDVQLGAPGDQILSRHSFAEVAAFVEDRLGRDALLRLITEAFDVVQRPLPSAAHMAAVRGFRAIVTTNYDELFENACSLQDIPFRVFTSADPFAEAPPGHLPIYKIDGSIGRPYSLVLTAGDAARAAANTGFWAGVTELVRECSLVVMGHSLRDANAQKLLAARSRTASGIYVSPYLDALDEVILNRYRLRGVRSTADDFMAGCGGAVSP